MIQQTISLTVNGRVRPMPAETTLPALLDAVGADRRVIAVAHNGDVVPRDDYDKVMLHDGDSIEVVRMVGGG